LLDTVDSHPLKQLYFAYLFFDKGEFENSLNMAERFLRRFSPEEKAEKSSVIELLVKIYVKLKRMDEAKSMLIELKDIAESINTRPLKAAYLSAEGYYNHAINNFSQARQNLEDAVDIYDSIAAPFESARTKIILAETLLCLNYHTQAEAEINSAISIFKELGAEKDFETAKSILKKIYKDNAGNKNEYEFTGRELEVLRLISGGSNNEEIAEKLFLSVRTVEKHITNIYGKLGISGKSARAYAASYAIKNNLIF
ncbi:MAG TPA: LuxR family transcriptional regulator, partial [Ignavibacteriaceae bacterium]|nr:LuxR family transcriptional regulator [Ignavibacteriaceae bacterium]